jgi:hypothetical protein
MRFLRLGLKRFEVPILKAMEVHFTPEQGAQLSRIASHAGTDTEHLVMEAALRLMKEDAQFPARGSRRHSTSRPWGVC